MDTKMPGYPDKFRQHLSVLRRKRERRKARTIRAPRQRLNAKDRRQILKKTGSRCHICGGKIDGKWQADHVLAYSGGGRSTHENYLPSHSLCNNYRWDYLPEEFQLILKIGVWARTQIERGTVLGNQICDRFASYEQSRLNRQRRR